MRAVHANRLRTHAAAVLACVCLSILGQLVYVGWLCLVWEDRSPRFAPPIGALANSRGEADSAQSQWLFEVYVDSPAGPATERTAFPLKPVLGWWSVARTARRMPASRQEPQIFLITPERVPHWTTRLSTTPPTHEDIERDRTIVDSAFGIPFPALAMSSDLRWNPSEVDVSDGIAVRPLTDAERAARSQSGRGSGPLGWLPTRVLWSGMLANILIGALVCATPLLAWSVLKVARSRARTSRGRCSACGYGPWNGSAVCPECGRRCPPVAREQLHCGRAGKRSNPSEHPTRGPGGYTPGCSP